MLHKQLLQHATLQLLPILHGIVNRPHDWILSSNMQPTSKFLTGFVSSTLLFVSVNYFILCSQSYSSYYIHCSMNNIAHAILLHVAKCRQY